MSRYRTEAETDPHGSGREWPQGPGRQRSPAGQDLEEGTQLRRSGKLGGDYREPVEALQNEPQDPAGAVQKAKARNGRRMYRKEQESRLRV